MNGLYPIIRRIRRPLLPPDDPAPVVPPVVVAPPPAAPPVEAELNPPQRQSGSDSATSAVNDPSGDY